MALYHFSVKQVSRGKGQTVVNSAAYISGQKLYNDYYGQTHDYTKKSGVVFAEILTPEYVPERLTDRETLWNEVEKVEKSKRAQLAYSFDIALQNELTLDENIELARAFCREQFVARGMIVDLAVHEGKSKNEDEPDNPHFHVLAPIRPFTEGLLPAFAFFPDQHFHCFRECCIIKFHYKIYRITSFTLTMPIPSVSGYRYTVMLFPTVFSATFYQLFSPCIQKRNKICLVCSCDLFFCILHFHHPFPSVLQQIFINLSHYFVFSSFVDFSLFLPQSVSGSPPVCHE